MSDQPRVREMSPGRSSATDRRRRGPDRHARSPRVEGRPPRRRDADPADRGRRPHRPGRAGQEQSRSSSTAPPAPARCAPPCSWRSSATSDVSSMAGGIGRWKAEGRPWELPERHARRSRPIRATPATWSCPRSGPRARASCSRRRCCSSVPAAWARRRCSTWRPPASARSASSTSTWSTCPTCSARSSTPTTASA